MTSWICSSEMEELLKEVKVAQYKDTTCWLEASRSLLLLADKEQNVSMKAQALLNLSEALFYRNDMESSVESVMEGISVCEKHQLVPMKANFYNLLGIILTKQGNEGQALDYLLKSLVCLDGYENYLMMANVYNNIASLYVSLGDYETAMKCYDTEKSFMEKEYRLRGRDEIYVVNEVNYLINRCLTYCSMKEYAKAIEYQRELQQYENSSEVANIKQFFYVVHAKIGFHVGDLDQFKCYVRLLLQECDSIPYKVDILAEYIEIFQYLLDSHELELAKQMLSVIEADLGSANSDTLFLNFYKVLANYYRQTHQEFELVNLYLEHYRLLKVQEKKIKEMKVINIKTKYRLHKEVVEQHRIEKEVTRLRQQTELDELTSLPNRYRMNEVCDELFQKAFFDQTNFGILILDIDYFKEYNDYHGHLEGDQCIRMVADCIQKNSQNLFCSRFGGDEFFLVAQNVSQEKLYEVAMAIQSSVMEKKFLLPENTGCRYVTVSQGICVGVPRAGQTYSDFVHAADMALYRGKKGNRNAIFIGDVNSQ